MSVSRERGGIASARLRYDGRKTGFIIIASSYKGQKRGKRGDRKGRLNAGHPRRKKEGKRDLKLFLPPAGREFDVLLRFAWERRGLERVRCWGKKERRGARVVSSPRIEV